MSSEMCMCGHEAARHDEQFHDEYVIPTRCRDCDCLHWTAPHEPCANCSALAKLADKWKRIAEAGERSKAFQRIEKALADVSNDRDALAAMVVELKDAIVKIHNYGTNGPATMALEALRKSGELVNDLDLPQAAKIEQARKKVCEAAKRVDACCDSIDYACDTCISSMQQALQALIDLSGVDL